MILGDLAVLGLAGAAGTLSRYGLSMLVLHGVKFEAPWPTLCCNVLGCLLFGFVVTASSENGWIPASYRIFLLTGFLGAFTTFSTFEHESFLLGNGRLLWGILNLAGQILLGLVALAAGIRLAGLTFSGGIS